MKSAYAPILLAFCCLSAPASAETGYADGPVCDAAAATGQAGDDCKALQAAYLDRVTACMTKRRDAAELALNGTSSNGAQTTRARHLLCAAEVRDAMGIAAN